MEGRVGGAGAFDSVSRNVAKFMRGSFIVCCGGAGGLIALVDFCRHYLSTNLAEMEIRIEARVTYSKFSARDCAFLEIIKPFSLLNSDCHVPSKPEFAFISLFLDFTVSRLLISPWISAFLLRLTCPGCSLNVPLKRRFKVYNVFAFV